MAATNGTCAACWLHESCLPAGLSPAELERFDTLVEQRRAVPRGDCVIRAGDRFTSLIVVRTGSFKTSVPIDGGEQVTGFPMAGALLGLDAISTGQQRCNAVALEDSHVCVLPFEGLERASRRLQPLQRTLHQMLSREIVRQRGLIVLLGALHAQQRVAAFILDVSNSLRVRRLSSKALVLRMSRAEIGSYLGLKLETVSRAMTHLHALGMLAVHHRRVQILDEKALRALAGMSGR